MTIAKGDFILMEYKASVKETGAVFDTVIREVAKEAGIYRENAIYEPMLVVVGEGWVLKSLDESLVGMEVGKKYTVEIPPERAFGLRDPNKIKLIPIKKFNEQKIVPTPGMEIDIDGRPATVRSVGAGRVQVDFNPPLAGRTLVYEVEIKSVLQEKEEKMKALIHRRIPVVEIEKFTFKQEDGRLTIIVPEEALFLEGFQAAKRGLAFDLQKFFPEIEVVEFIERYMKKKEGEK